MNGPLDKSEQVYEILEYWFCTKYMEKDKSEHVKELEDENNLEKKEDAGFNSHRPVQICAKPEVPELPPDNYWDRHTTINPKAVQKWFMGGDDQD